MSRPVYIQWLDAASGGTLEWSDFMPAAPSRGDLVMLSGGRWYSVREVRWLLDKGRGLTVDVVLSALEAKP